MSKPHEKTNAMRALEQRKIPYEPYMYDEGLHSAADVAASIGIPAQQVFKTLVMLPASGRPVLIMMPGDAEVDPRRLAQSINVKRIDMAPKRDAEQLTGLLTGGIGALALLGKPFQVLIERSAMRHESILVNAGRRGINLRIAVDDLVRVTSARIVDAITHDVEIPPDSENHGRPQ